MVDMTMVDSTMAVETLAEAFKSLVFLLLWLLLLLALPCSYSYVVMITSLITTVRDGKTDTFT